MAVEVAPESSSSQYLTRDLSLEFPIVGIQVERWFLQVTSSTAPSSSSGRSSPASGRHSSSRQHMVHREPVTETGDRRVEQIGIAMRVVMVDTVCGVVRD